MFQISGTATVKRTTKSMKNFKIIISAHHFKNKFLFFYRTHVVPIKDIRSLNLTFPIPDYQEHYTKKPVSYVSHLIGKK